MQTLPSRLALAASLTLGACAPLPTVPDNLRPAGQAQVASVSARGVQVYACRVPAAGGAPAWVFVAPRAELFDEAGAPFGSHGAGPFWQARDGSRIVGSVVARSDAPAAGAIPWLLLATKPDGGAPGRLAGVTSVQRLNTVGGIAPADGCDAGAVGRTVEVDYTAEYRLFAAAR